MNILNRFTKFTVIDIKKSLEKKESVVVGTALLDPFYVVTVRPLVSMKADDAEGGTTLQGSVLTLETKSADKVMYVLESPEEVYELLEMEEVKCPDTE